MKKVIALLFVFMACTVEAQTNVVTDGVLTGVDGIVLTSDTYNVSFTTDYATAVAARESLSAFILAEAMYALADHLNGETFKTSTLVQGCIPGNGSPRCPITALLPVAEWSDNIMLSLFSGADSASTPELIYNDTFWVSKVGTANAIWVVAP